MADWVQCCSCNKVMKIGELMHVDFDGQYDACPHCQRKFFKVLHSDADTLEDLNYEHRRHLALGRDMP